MTSNSSVFKVHLKGDHPFGVPTGTLGPSFISLHWWKHLYFATTSLHNLEEKHSSTRNRHSYHWILLRLHWGALQSRSPVWAIKALEFLQQPSLKALNSKISMYYYGCKKKDTRLPNLLFIHVTFVECSSSCNPTANPQSHSSWILASM